MNEWIADVFLKAKIESYSFLKYNFKMQFDLELKAKTEFLYTFWI